MSSADFSPATKHAFAAVIVACLERPLELPGVVRGVIEAMGLREQYGDDEASTYLVGMIVRYLGDPAAVEGLCSDDFNAIERACVKPPPTPCTRAVYCSLPDGHTGDHDDGLAI